MPVELIPSIASLRTRLSDVRRSPATLALVPTMGALHAGHARLIEQARRECQRVVVSIFVNPLQFDRSEDLQGYPKSIDADLAMCNQLGVEGGKIRGSLTRTIDSYACAFDFATALINKSGADS